MPTGRQRATRQKDQKIHKTHTIQILALFRAVLVDMRQYSEGSLESAGLSLGRGQEWCNLPRAKTSLTLCGTGGRKESGKLWKQVLLLNFLKIQPKVLLLPVYRRAKELLYFSGEGYSSFLCLGKIICESTLPLDYNKLFNLW